MIFTAANLMASMRNKILETSDLQDQALKDMIKLRTDLDLLLYKLNLELVAIDRVIADIQNTSDVDVAAEAEAKKILDDKRREKVKEMLAVGAARSGRI